MTLDRTTEYDIRDWYWTVADDETQVYASARGAMVAADDAVFEAWCAAGKTPTRVATMDELIGVLRAANIPPYHRVTTSIIVARLQAADPSGQLFAAAHQAILANPALFWRFVCAPQGAINGDDADAHAFLVALGADPAAILARP